MAADIRIARKGNYQVGLPEVALGVLAGTGGTARLSRLVGKAKAMEIMVTGRKFSFEESREMDLVHDIYDSLSLDEFRQDVLDYAGRFSLPFAASKAIGNIKRSVQVAWRYRLSTILLLKELQSDLFQSEDARKVSRHTLTGKHLGLKESRLSICREEKQPLKYPLMLGQSMADTDIVQNYPTNFESWIEMFNDWQTRIGFDPSWLGDYSFDIKFDWDTAGAEIEFGDFEGMPKWERRMQIPQQNITDAILTMVSVQGDTEFASVEQQNHLLETAPTEYDKKSALRIMCEEQRHGWQMAYLLCTFFGEQGVREAAKLLERNAQEGTRILGSFNEPIDHWLDFFMFTHFIDRDGKYQLKMLSTSSFKPLAASMGPMLKEESFHLGTGANGLRRVVKQGVIPCSLIQKYINKWVSTGLDLFGTDDSSSAEWAYVYGIKGRYDEREADTEADREHLNEASRDLYFQELRAEMGRISKARKEGEPELYIPSDKFNRGIGKYAGKNYTVEGEFFEGSEEEYQAYLDSVLPTDEDEDTLVNVYMKEDWIQYREWKGK